MTSDANPLLEMTGGSVRLNDRLVFRRTHWALRRGEHWVVIGPNGAGKSVFCGALCGEHPVVEGTIDYHFPLRTGRVPEQCVERLSFEQAGATDSPGGVPSRWFSLDLEESPPVSALLSHDGVEGVNEFEVLDRSPAEFAGWNRRARRIIRLLGIDPLMQQPLLSLSNGERRKVMIARALMRRPRILILDDPFTGLDVNYRRHLRSVLETLVRGNVVTLLLVSARPDEWPRGMTHLMLIDRFRLLAGGPLRRMRRDARCARLLNAGSGRRPACTPVRRLRTAGSDGEELVRFRNVQVRWGKKVVLAHIDWTVREGESWAVVGPNGSGKSTILSLILGENPQVYANEVRVFGRRRGTGESVWRIKRGIGWISPELHLGFHTSLSALESVLTGFFDASVLNRAPASWQRRAAMAWLRRLRMAHLADRPFGLMSAGEQRTVLLARALVKTPRLLMLDEPCQGLDVRHRRLFVTAVDRLVRQGVTVLYVTHQWDEVPPSIGRVLRLGNGRAHVMGEIRDCPERDGSVRGTP